MEGNEDKKYKMVPLDEPTHERLLTLCAAYGMGKRSQGAFVRKLIDVEYKKLADVKLLAPASVVEEDEAA